MLQIKNKGSFSFLILLMLFSTGFVYSQTGQRYKQIDYDYDLVSGNVKQVSVQAEEADALYHKYEYDADNRIVAVYTSTDGVIWEKDADYFYYKHGPLARTELGDQKVQAQDYVYTLQGWIKGVNSNTLEAANDPGQDGINSNYSTIVADIHSKIGRDAYGYSLSYYDADGTNNDKDYQAININSASFIADATSNPSSTPNDNLFNGNIKRMVSTITDLESGSATYGQAIPQLTAYKYDQLNRIKQLKAYRDINITNNLWLDATAYDGAYETEISYDANGNITHLKRNGESGNLVMDDMTYQYDWIDPNDHSKGLLTDLLRLFLPTNNQRLYPGQFNRIFQRGVNIDIKNYNTCNMLVLMANGEGYFYQLFDNSKTVITVDTSTLLKHNSSLKFSGFKDGSYILTVGNNNNEEGRRENIEEQRKIVNRFHPLG